MTGYRPISAIASRMAGSAPSICCGVPTVIRTHPRSLGLPTNRAPECHADASTTTNSRHRADAYQNEVRLARPVAQPEFVEQLPMLLAPLLHLRDMIRYERLVGQRLFQTSQHRPNSH